MKLETEVGILIAMIQRPTGRRLSCNFSMYKDDVTRYRQKLYTQAMKIHKITRRGNK